MPYSNAPVLRQSVRWGEEYVSRALNIKFAGIIQPGIYKGFKLKPNGLMSVLIEHDEDYARSVAVVERDGYSLTIFMDDPGVVQIPARGIWHICIEAFYAPTQQGYQRIVARKTAEPYHIVLGTVNCEALLDDDGNIIDNSPVAINPDMISDDSRQEDHASLKIQQQFQHLADLINSQSLNQSEYQNLVNSFSIAFGKNLIRLSNRIALLEMAAISNGINIPADSLESSLYSGITLPTGETIAPVTIADESKEPAPDAALTLVFSAGQD